MYFNTTGSENTAVGFDAGYNGPGETAIGENALSSDHGIGNTGVGQSALYFNQGGYSNTACGQYALYSNDFGSNNTAIGTIALEYNTGSNNCGFGVGALLGGSINSAAFGYQALGQNASASGQNNVAVGCQALFSDNGGNTNSAIGYQALYSNTTAANNTATGAQALFSNTTGLDNAADGYQALYSNTTGNYNVADGQGALYSNTTGRNNTASGQNALHSNTIGSNNIALGSNAGIRVTSGSNNIDLFHQVVAGEANTIRIGKQGTQTATFIAGISGATVPTGVAVIVDANGHLGTTTSSARFKEAIKPMDYASEAIFALKPVTFRYKHDLDPVGVPQFGLLAEQVEKVNPDLVARDEQGKPYSVRYEAANAMLLLNEFLKAHRRIEEQDKRIEELTAQLNQQAAQIQKVSAKLELNKGVPEIVSNNY